MGSSPKTKADYRKKIASKEAELARAKARRKTCPPDGINRTRSLLEEEIAELQGDIAKLKAKMADAPSK